MGGLEAGRGRLLVGWRLEQAEPVLDLGEPQLELLTVLLVVAGVLARGAAKEERPVRLRVLGALEADGVDERLAEAEEAAADALDRGGALMLLDRIAELRRVRGIRRI